MNSTQNENKKQGRIMSAYNWPVIESTYNEAGRVIMAMSEELTELRTKYGETKPFVVKKAQQIKALTELYDRSLDMLQQQRKVLQMAELVNFYRNVDLMSKETGLPYEKIFALLGGKDRSRIPLDQRIREMYTQMYDALAEDNPFEDGEDQ